MTLRGIFLRIFILLWILIIASSAFAASYSAEQNGNDSYMIMDGSIDIGEAQKFIDEKNRLIGRDNNFTLVVNSPGGIIDEGLKIAAIVKSNNLDLIVPSKSKCASSCFLIFAAARSRSVWNDARVGVHSAISYNPSTGMGAEDTFARAETVRMARIAYRYFGVPDKVVGKMVTTNPENMTWLDSNDLTLMGAVIIGGSVSTTQQIPNSSQSLPERLIPQIPDNSDISSSQNAPQEPIYMPKKQWCRIHNPNALLNIRDSNFRVIDTLEHGDIIYVHYSELTSANKPWSWVTFQDFLGDTTGWVSTKFLICNRTK